MATPTVMPLDEAAQRTRSGDVWLFTGRKVADRAIRAATNSPVNHVAMVLTVDDLPPLRERKDDIHPLCRYFFDQYRKELGKTVASISPEVINILVPSEQRDLVYDTLYRAAGLDVTGKGFIYMTPLEKVSTYIPESLQTRLDKNAGEAP